MDLSNALEVASCSNAGMVRSHNEDAIFVDAQNGLAILADGMGGYNAGEVASGMAVMVLSNGISQGMTNVKSKEKNQETGLTQTTLLIKDQIAVANSTIFEAARSQPQCAGMGTTLVVTQFYDNQITVAHIGDSRLYRLRGEVFEQLTKDHSLLQEQIDSGLITPEQARYSHNKNLVTRALGIDPKVEPEIHDYEVEPGDLFLLCSDGLNDMIPDEDIGLTLQALQTNLPLAAEQLVQMANDNGGRDNVSVVLVRIAGKFAAPSGLFSRFLSWFE
jgi:protein phosphatase